MRASSCRSVATPIEGGPPFDDLRFVEARLLLGQADADERADDAADRRAEAEAGQRDEQRADGQHAAVPTACPR